MFEELTFELEENEQDKRINKNRKQYMKSDFKPIASKILIKRGGETIGHIHTPAGTGENITNGIQICGFTEAFDFWGCGIFRGYKDIQLLFDEGIMGGIDHKLDLRECLRCYRKPCQCETPQEPISFKVKRREELKDRLNKR